MHDTKMENNATAMKSFTFILNPPMIVDSVKVSKCQKGISTCKIAVSHKNDRMCDYDYQKYF